MSIASYASVRFISPCPPQGHSPKRAGPPHITIRTATFAQLLKDAQTWDNRHPAMHRAQEGWLVQSFCFADDFCAYAAAEERPAPQQPKTSLARRVKRLLLYGALLLLSLSGAARAQEPPQLSAYMGVTRLSEEFYLHRWYAICNTDPYAYIDVIQISEFGAPVEVTQAPPGWTCSQSSEYDFDCAAEWNPVAPGMCLGGFVIWSGEYNWAPVKLLLGGRYNDLDDPGAVLLDYTWGPGGGS